MKVEIDSGSGFCGGVIRAISQAEKFLDANGGPLYSLGAIVHNEAELNRLSGKGLVTLDLTGLQQLLQRAKDSTVLIRAHGQAPAVYGELEKLGFNIIDCTCPVVLNIQKMIRQAWLGFKNNGKGGQIVIFGKLGHAEVLGLVGQTESEATVVENVGHLESLIADGKIDSSKDIALFSQTTASPAEYRAVAEALESSMKDGAGLTVNNTICSQVAGRHKNLLEFAGSHDVIVFVSGLASSNGKVLYNLCRRVNDRTYHVSDVSEIRKEWFGGNDSVGVCGATSTPKWLLEKAAREIENLQ